MLWTHGLALSALYAVACFAMFFSQQIVVQSAVGELAFAQLLNHIHQTEILWNGDVLWAFACAVVARCARNVDVFGNGVNHMADEVGFLLVQRLEILHVTGVVVKLLHIAHAAEHRQHIRQRSAVANCPRCRAHVGVHLFHHLLHFGRHICQTAALHRLHHNHWFAVFFANLVALPALHGAVPVDIVDLQLYIFKFGVCGKHMLQRFAVVVKRESDMLRLALGLQLLQEFPAVDMVEQFDVILVDGVEPVVVEILQPSASELNVEHPLQIVVGGDAGILSVTV